jgi:hypothetical protein
LSLTWLTGLYEPAKDLARGAATLRSRRVALTIEAHAQGSLTRIIVTAQCGFGGKPVHVRGCRAELYATAFDSCVEPQPVRARMIDFRPGGPVTIKPGELPVQWEAQVLNEHVRRAVRELNDAATIRAWGEERGHAVLEERDCFERDAAARRKQHHPLRAALAQLVGEPPRPKMRAVLEPLRGDALATKAVRIPPLAPFTERLDHLLNVCSAERRSTLEHRRIKKHGEAST